MKKLLMVLALGCAACAGSSPEPRVPLREAVCKTEVLLYALGNNEDLVNKVLAGELTIDDAIGFVGGMAEDALFAREQLKACEALTAAPPAYGNKVI